MAIGAVAVSTVTGGSIWNQWNYFPLMIAAAGILSSIIGTFLLMFLVGAIHKKLLLMEL